ncbi:putative short-chain dehydrogenases/reductase [Periconia macrospinosa]|uniref:Putative short-chain dehydrogenases/reductase n=1 Tax=Periconia macrospinosa TaxID=97972 RepID=A0A2V1E1E1_9PLEO|nr:putative short-chain dehydrogenases/reductase [Periconia macrospinosa]
METVLIVGATGNIGTAAAKGALSAGRNVLAVVRNSASADKLFQNLGTKDRITTIEADILSENGVQSVVHKVKEGKLPAFQHVYAAAGGAYGTTALKDVTMEEMRKTMRINFETNFAAYCATIPYLLEQNNPNSTWTLCTGSQGELGKRATPAITQGALFSMAVAACQELTGSNIRFNEVLLNGLVEVDRNAERSGVMKASDFAKNYEAILGRPDINGCRIRVDGYKDLTELKYTRKLNL